MESWLKSFSSGMAAMLFVIAAPAQPVVERGLMDLRAWDFRNQGPLTLHGTWDFYWQALIPPGEIVPAKDHFHFPGIWNNAFSVRHELTGQGFATYSARILVDPSVSMLSMELPDFYTNYELWINGTSVARNGEVGTSRIDSEPQWLPHTIVFPAMDTLNIVLQVSNFHHKRGGCNDHIYLGLPDQLYGKREMAVITNIILFGGLGLIGVFFIVLFSFFKSERTALFFAALCITWAIRSLFTNLYLFINWLPSMDWELAVKVEYVTLYLAMMWSVLFVSGLFPKDVNNAVKYALMILNLIFILFTIATPAATYTNLLTAYLLVAWVILGYIAVVVTRALVFERGGAWFSAGSVILGVIMFSYDMMTFQGFGSFNPILFNVGYLAIFLLNATAIAHQLSMTVGPRPAMELGLTLK